MLCSLVARSICPVLFRKARPLCGSSAYPSLRADGVFEFGTSGYRALVADEELLACLSTRSPLKCPEDGIACVVLNARGTDRVCTRVQSECGVPTVLGWGDQEVPGSLCVAMVRAGRGLVRDFVRVFVRATRGAPCRCFLRLPFLSLAARV